jgi:cobalt-zinc-cadmium efflux system protein
VDGPLLMGVAAAGLAVNVTAALLLHSHAKESLNVRGAYLHVLGDLLGSIGALVAGAVILLTGWYAADSVVSVLIALLILASSWRLVREATDVLLEAAPSHIDVQAVRSALEAIPELYDVHDLHVWTLTSGFVALSGHGVIDDPTRHGDVLARIQERLGRFGIEHITFQLEPRPLYQMKARGGARGGSAQPRAVDEDR